MKVTRNRFSLNTKPYVTPHIKFVEGEKPTRIDVSLLNGRYCSIETENHIEIDNCIQNNLPLFTLCHEKYLRKNTSQVKETYFKKDCNYVTKIYAMNVFDELLYTLNYSNKIMVKTYYSEEHKNMAYKMEFYSAS